MEGDDETTNVLDSSEGGWVAILLQVRIMLEYLELYSPWPRRSLVEGLEHQSAPFS